MATALLRFSADRAVQLREIAALRGVPVSGLIDRLVFDAIRYGEIADRTPGITMEPSSDGTVALTVDGLVLSSVPADELCGIADELEAKRRSLTYLDAGFVEVGPLGGTAVELKVTTPAGEVRRVFTKSVAFDVARQLRNAAERSKLN